MGAASTSELCEERIGAAPLVCLKDIWTYLPGGKKAYRAVSATIGMVSKQYCLYNHDYVSHDPTKAEFF